MKNISLHSFTAIVVSGMLAIFIGCLGFGLNYAAQASTGSTTVEATVPNWGQGTGQPINMAVDQTKKFEQVYGVHSEADIVFSQFNFFLMDLLIIIFIVAISAEYQHKHHAKISKVQGPLLRGKTKSI